jgi:zinc metalloprotease ZmpB
MRFPIGTLATATRKGGTFVRHLLIGAVAAFVLAAASAALAATGTSTGSGRVFFPNPVAQLQNQTLTDQKDADYAALQQAYVVRPLTNLDGSGFLRGDWANIVSETGNPAFSSTNTFHYDRSQDEFEQVMAYYWVTEAQKYIQTLGFGSRLRPVNMESQDIRINQWGADNSFSWDKKDLLKFGKGGVDDAEDAEVVLHEYGHAIQDSQQTPHGYGFSVEARSIGEGFADYWAVTVADVVAPTSDPACVADWDSVFYTSTVPHCLRRVDEDLHYPEDLNGAVHHDGQIWSRALWDIRGELGNAVADTIILEAHFGMPDPTMPELAASTVAAAQRLFGNAAANKTRAAFVARGILGK